MRIFGYFSAQKRQLLANSDCLKKGLYYLHGNFRTYLYLGTRHNVIDFPEGSAGIKHAIKLLIGRIFYSVWIPKDGEKFQADAVYFANTGFLDDRDTKLFSYKSEDKTVLTRSIDRQHYSMYMSNRAKASKNFPLPDLIYQDDALCMYAERIVGGISWREDEERARLVYLKLFGFYKNYYSFAKLCNYLISENERCAQPSEIQEPDKCMTALHHGDLSSDNFKVQENHEIIFMDFEHADFFPLYYDVFFLIFNEAVVNGNFFGYNLLLNGEFDGYFKNCSEKKNYLTAFMHCFWHRRLGRVNSETYKKLYLDLYKTAIGRQ